jgi:acyl-CoA reductase-like NAD-dependent aldehyde dehydrogenase
MANSLTGGVTFTGSSGAGVAAQVLCARRRIPFQGELGGNNAAIVWSDADLEQAATLLALGGFGNAGQRCTATRRVIVDRQCAARFFEFFQQAVAGLKWGDPLDPLTQVGPVISRRAMRRIAGVIDRAREAGATICVPHDSETHPRSGTNGFYVPPTIIRCHDPTSEIVQEETFGPVVVLQEAAAWDEALALCNGVSQGLVASLFSESKNRQESFLAESRAGMLRINGPTAGASAGAPFGGWKASGIGPAEHGPADVEFYTRWQTIYALSQQPAILPD